MEALVAGPVTVQSGSANFSGYTEEDDSLGLDDVDDTLGGLR
jgi:hypothetical protein